VPFVSPVIVRAVVPAPTETGDRAAAPAYGVTV
jgi:hypothetical protein